jgi:hypothetical protein
MSVYLLDENYDTYLDANNRIARSKSNIDGVKVVARCKLNTFLREVFTDTTKGVDWFGVMFNPRLNIVAKNQELERVLRTIPEIKSVDSFEWVADKENRQVQIYISITCIYGEFKLDDLTIGV